jgi:Holliday junction resolvase RusA-like endonuclease
MRIGKRLALLDDPALKAAKLKLALLFRRHRPKSPLEGALRLEISIHFPWLKSHTKTQRLQTIMPKSTTPDCSNLAKTIEDVLAAEGFMKNDSQVSRLLVHKWYSDKPGITIILAPLEALVG